MLQTAELRESIENLYRVFSRYGLRANTDACTCHHSAEDEKRIHRKPLRTLSHEDLRQYAQDAIYIWGTGDDFKHFIPRLFELLALPDQDSGFSDAAGLLNRLSYDSWCSSHWHTWPDEEQKAIGGYLQSAWAAVLDSAPDDLPFDGAFGWIQAIAQAEGELAPYLERWLNAESLNAHRNLAQMIIDHRLPSVRISGGAYWDAHREQWQQLNDWVARPGVRQKLADAFERWSDLPVAGELMDAAVLLP